MSIVASIDVKDAFLTVKQEVDTRVTCTDANGNSMQYSLGSVLPGQRDGSLLWHRDLAKFVGVFAGNDRAGCLPKHFEKQEW